MPAILIRIFTWMMTSIAGQVLFSLGLGVISFTSLNTLLGFIVEKIKQGFGSASHEVLVFVYLLSLDHYISILISAFLIKVSITSAQVALSKRG